MSIAREVESRFQARFTEYARTLDCVHCGLCIPNCPTHGITGRESDSPRGRIYLMRSYAEKGLDLSPRSQLSIDQCIVCRACETVCPSGIRMGDMMEAFRDELRQRRRLPRAGEILGALLLNQVLPHRDRIALATHALEVYQRSGVRPLVQRFLRRFAPGLLQLEQLQPDLPARELRHLETTRERPGGYPAEGKARMRVGLFLGCIASEWFAHVHRATIRVLQKNGCDVVLLEDQTCCGALHRHAGRMEDAARLHARNVAAFDEARLDAIVVNAAGCGAALKEAPHGKAQFQAPVRDVCELLHEVGILPPTSPLHLRVAHHQACHLVHGQGLGPHLAEDLLSQVPGLTVIRIRDSDRCCGSGGVYNLLHPKLAAPLQEEKVASIREAGEIDAVVTGNPGCAMQIRAGLAKPLANAFMPREIEVLHPVELLDRAYALERSVPTAPPPAGTR